MRFQFPRPPGTCRHSGAAFRAVRVDFHGSALPRRGLRAMFDAAALVRKGAIACARAAKWRDHGRFALFFRYDFQICEVKSMQSKEREAGPEPIEVAVRSWLAGIRVSAATKETYARAIKPFAGFLEAGGIGLEDARRRDVERYVDGLMEDGPSLRPRRAVPRGRQIALLIPLGIGLQKPSRRGSRPENEQDVQSAIRSPGTRYRNCSRRCGGRRPSRSATSRW